MTVPLEPLHHPDDETIAAFVDGMLPNTERHDFLEHLAKCEGCYALWDGVEETRALSAAQTGGGKVARGRFGKGRLVLTAAALAAAASVAAYVYVPQVLLERDRQGLERAAAEVAYRPTAARLSIDVPHRSMKSQLRDVRVPPLYERDLAPIYGPAAAVTKWAERRPNAATLRSRGLAFLLMRKPEQALLDLQKAERTGNADVQLLVDLSAAALAAAEASDERERGRLAALALDYATRAWKEAQTPTTAWNRALALEAAGRNAEAIAAWKQYQALDPSSEWAAEAREKHIPRLQSR